MQGLRVKGVPCGGWGTLGSLSALTTCQALAVSDPSGETVRTLLKDFYDARTGFRKCWVYRGFQGWD